MVQINVSQLLKEPIGSTRNYTASDVVDITGNSSLIQGEIKLMRTDRSVLARAILDTKVELTCSRCLNIFGYPLMLNVEEEYFPTTDMVTGASLPLPDETGGFTIDGNNILDLTEAIRQYALVAIPMKPLCNENCAGLCPTCGRNLNQLPCDCPAEPVDPRWSELGKLVLVDSEASANEQKGIT